MSTRYGLIFRNTIGATTTPANTAHARAADDEPYPTTVNGVTFGWLTGGGGSDNGNWSSGQSPLLAGYWAVGNGDGPERIKVALPAPGAYRAWMLHADSVYANNNPVIRDGEAGDVLASASYYNGGSGDGTQWREMDNTAHAYSSAPDFGAMAYADVTFTGAVMVIENGAPSGLFVSRLIGVFWEALDEEPPTMSVTTQPTSTVSGSPTSAVVVTSTDTGFTGTVTATLLGGSTLSGTTSVAAVAGIATFSNLIPSGAGTGRSYHFTAPGYAAIDSATFPVTSDDDEDEAAPPLPGDLMTDEQYAVDSTGVIATVDIFDENNRPKTGLVWSAVTCRSQGSGGGAPAVLTLQDMTLGIWADGGFKQVHPTLAPGSYQFGIPNVLLETIGRVLFFFTGTGIGYGKLRLYVNGSDPLAAAADVPAMQNGLARTTDLVTVNNNVQNAKAVIDAVAAKANLIVSKEALSQEVLITTNFGRGNKGRVNETTGNYEVTAPDGMTVIVSVPRVEDETLKPARSIG